MAKQSAGLLMYRKKEGAVEVFLVHPGGPFWKNKDEGAWSIPKGEFKNEEPLKAAKREFKEETGFEAGGDFIKLSPIIQSGGKKVFAWAFEGDCDPEKIQSNTFTMEWPPKSGKEKRFPEIDCAAWYKEHESKRKILKSQLPLLEEFIKKIR